MSGIRKYRRGLARDRALRIEAAAIGVRPRELKLAREVAAVLGVDESLVVAKARQTGISSSTLDAAYEHRQWMQREEQREEWKRR